MIFFFTSKTDSIGMAKKWRRRRPLSHHHHCCCGQMCVCVHLQNFQITMYMGIEIIISFIEWKNWIFTKCPHKKKSFINLKPSDDYRTLNNTATKKNTHTRKMFNDDYRRCLLYRVYWIVVVVFVDVVLRATKSFFFLFLNHFKCTQNRRLLLWS